MSNCSLPDAEVQRAEPVLQEDRGVVDKKGKGAERRDRLRHDARRGGPGRRDRRERQRCQRLRRVKLVRERVASASDRLQWIATAQPWPQGRARSPRRCVWRRRSRAQSIFGACGNQCLGNKSSEPTTTGKPQAALAIRSRVSGSTCEGLYRQDRIRAAEGKGVADGGPYRALARRPRRYVQVAFGVEVLDVDGRRNDA